MHNLVGIVQFHLFVPYHHPRWLSCLHCSLTARRSWVRFPHGALLALGGRSSPECTVLKWAISRPFCVEFACSPRVHKGFPPLITPTEKHAKRTEQSCPSLTETDGSIGPRALRSCPLLLEDPGGGTIRDGLKAEQKFTATSGLRVRVCSVSWSPPYIYNTCELCVH